MVAQKALQHSVAPWGNYAQKIDMIYPKYHFPLLAVLGIQFRKLMKYMISFVTKDSCINTQWVFLNVRLTLDMPPGKLVL